MEKPDGLGNYHGGVSLRHRNYLRRCMKEHEKYDRGEITRDELRKALDALTRVKGPFIPAYDRED